jgi:soluble lytic murein transglycosylase
VIPEQVQHAVLALPGIIRARELLFVNWVTEARREWVHVINTIEDKAQLAAAAALASQWGWHNRAIATVAKAGNYDDLSLRFPTPHYDAVLTYATQRELPYSLVYAVMRQESAFQADARSVSNALGLMQLLPATAREVAQRDNITLENEASILIPDINIQLGTGYLRYLMNRFDNNKILVTAAYNAGPSRSIRWRREFGCNPTDLFVELIPFRQTRDYVQNIMAYMPIFEYRLLGIDTVQRLNFTALEMRSDCE